MTQKTKIQKLYPLQHDEWVKVRQATSSQEYSLSTFATGEEVGQ